MPNANEILASVVSYELANPVEEYSLKGLPCWPFLRIYAVTNSYAKNYPSVASKAMVGREGKLAKLKRNLSLSWRDWSHSTLASWRDAAKNARIEDCVNADIAFLDDAHSRRFQLGGCHYNIIHDPLQDQFPALKMFAFETSYDGNYKIPRYRPSLYVSGAMELASLRAKLNYSFSPPPTQPSWFRPYADLYKLLSGDNLDFACLWRLQCVIEKQSEVFSRALERLSPKALFVVCWYSWTAMAALMGASRVGVKTVDFQHGLWPLVYSSWRKAPVGPSPFFPDFFWTWGDDASRCLLESSSEAVMGDRVVCGGLPWLNLWRDMPSDSPIAAIAKQARAAFPKASKKILVTMLEPDWIKDIAGLIAKSPVDWLWMVRCHPAYLAHMPQIRATLASTGQANWELDAATSLPLYSLIFLADTHLTWVSSCALECLAFGVRSLLIHPDGQNIFGEYIKSGDMFYTQDVEEMMRWLVSDARGMTSSNPSQLYADASMSAKALERILGRKAW